MVPLVSVVIPTYNREGTICDCLDSVCNQTYPNIEIIVVDDCSTDNTKEIILNYKDSRVKYYRLQSNSGACVARNKGVELASGDIVAFQDSDDIWHKQKLEKQVHYLLLGKYEFITCGFIRFGHGKEEKIGYKDIGNDKTEVFCNLLNGNWVSTQTIVCYKYCFEKISFDKRVRRFQDWDIALQAVKYYRIGAMNEYLVNVYLQDDSITVKNKTYESMIYILGKHKVDVDFRNHRMSAQYYKTLGDIERLRNPMKAVKIYMKSIKEKFSLKLILVSIMCFTGMIKIYDRRHT